MGRPPLSPLRFAEQNEKFEDCTFTGHIMNMDFDKLGNLRLYITVSWDQKDALLPNLSYATAMPVKITVEGYNGR